MSNVEALVRRVAVLLLWPLVGCLPATGVSAQPMSLVYRSTAGLPGSTTDQHGSVFTIAGLSGITYAGREPSGAERFLAVMDNSDKIVMLDVVFSADGAIAEAFLIGGIRLAEARDFEGITYTGPVRNSVLLAEEGTPAVHEFDLDTGARLRTLAAPSVFLSRRANLGFESLACGPGLGEFWTANEEALVVDGPASTPTTGTIVRLLRYRDRSGRAPRTSEYAYVTAPIHGALISGARSGVSDLIVLPDGRLLTLERSFALASPLFRTRVYEVSFINATEVSGFGGGLVGELFTPVTKALLYSGAHANLEGLAVGPFLPDGALCLVGIVDDGDPVSLNQLVSFRLTGAGTRPRGQPLSPLSATPR